MVKVSLKGMWAHKRRLFGTIFAVVLGVAFLAGTLVLGDTMRAGFDDIFTEANEGTDAIVRNETEIGEEMTTQRGYVDADLATTIRDIDGVAAAEPAIQGFAQIIDKDGDPIGGNGPPTLAGSWIDDPTFNPWAISEGRAPEASGEVVIDQRTADDEDFAVGDPVTVNTPTPVDATIVGFATFGELDSLAGATFTAFTYEDAQQLFVPDPSKASSILVAAAPGVSQEQLVADLDPVLPDGVEALSGTAQTAEDNEDINDDFIGFFETFLLVFAGIALLVATFSIYNTFSIIIAQRTRESALLRAIGASRRQILTAIGLEAVMIGIVASIVGLLSGIALAAGLQTLFDALGFAGPDAPLSVKAGTVVWSFAVGMLVTLTATMFPAIRGSRVPPLAALRDVSLDRTHTSKVRMVLGALFTIAGVVLVVTTALGDGEIEVAGLGAVLTIVGVVVLGPVVARPAAFILGSPLPRFRKITGALARENAMRNPRRTAATASALMVGVGVVTLFTVLAASVKVAIDDTVSDQFGGDLVIADQNFSGAGLSPQLATDVEELPEVESAVGLGLAAAEIDGKTPDITTADPAKLDEQLDIGVIEGSLQDMTDTQLAVSEEFAEGNGWVVGDTTDVHFVGDDTTEQFTIGAIYDSTELVDDVTMPTAAWSAHTAQPFDIVVMIELADGVSLEEGKAAVTPIADAYAAPDVQDRDEYVDSVAGQIDMFLAVVYVLLFLAIIIALMGIANTLSLSVYERTRELGLLRAVGQSRKQLRAMVRWESVVIAVFGTVGGIMIGLFLGWGLLEVTSASEDIPAPYTVPFGQLLAVLIVGGLVGILAGWMPARRAAKLDILDAIATE